MFRSIAIIEEVVNELVSLGLLTKDGEVFQKTEDFSEFYYLLKNKVKRSLRRYVAWAICLYCQKKLTSFSTTELVTLLSYRDDDYIDEMPHLVKSKENGWFKLLEKSGEEWKLLEEPHIPSSPILLTHINGRLSHAIFELSKTKDKFMQKKLLRSYVN